jgi:hypothetical protein
MPNHDTVPTKIICHAHTGYRRAGLAFNHGENHIDTSAITPTQWAMLKDDPRLSVSEGISTTQVPISDPPSSPPDSQGALEPVGLSDDLASGIAKDLTEAIGLLSPDDKTHFTTSGKPQTDALTQLMGGPVSASQRDAAWTVYKQATAAESKDK